MFYAFPIAEIKPVNKALLSNSERESGAFVIGQRNTVWNYFLINTDIGTLFQNLQGHSTEIPLFP